MLGDRGYDADWYRDALQAKELTPYIPGENPRIIPSNMTSAATEAGVVSRLCSVV